MTKPSRILSLLSLTGLVLLGLVPGCSREEATSLQQPMVADEQVDLQNGGEGEIYVLQVVDGADIIRVANSEGIDLIEVDEESGTGTYSTTGWDQEQLMDLEQNHDIDFTGPPVPTALTGPVNGLLGFFQTDYINISDDGSEWTDDLYYTQDALACLNIEEIRDHPPGLGFRPGIIAVLDTGVDPRHPHLADNIVTLDPEDAGRIEQFEFAPDGIGTDAAFGHGTHVAGTILAMAPGAQILPLKVLNDDGVGDDMTLAIAMDIAAEYGAMIVNLSLVVDGESELVDARLNKMVPGTHIVAAAGNLTGPPMYPAIDPRTVAVSSTLQCLTLSNWSAYSGQYVKFAAPGEDVISSYPLGPGGEVRLAIASGTSTSCALVTGAYYTMLASLQLGDPLKSLQTTALPVSPQGTVRFGVASPFHALGLE